MSPELSNGLQVLFWIMYLGMVWLTIGHKLKRIEKMLSEKFEKADSKSSSPNNVGNNKKPKDGDSK